MIEAVEIEIPVAGITELEIQFGGGSRVIESTTAPLDTTAIWLDPESGITAVYIGGGWVTQLESSGVPDGAYVNGSGAYYINGSGAFYISI